MNIEKSRKNRLWCSSSFCCKKYMKKNWMESNSPIVSVLILTLMKEFETIVTEKQHFDYRDESFSSINFLELLDYPDYDAWININRFWKETSPVGRACTWDLAGRKQAYSYRETWCWIATKSENKINTRYCQDIRCKTSVDWFLNRSHFCKCTVAD